MGSFLSGIFTGANPSLPGDINESSGVAGYGIGTGESDLNQASGFYGDLLSGNESTEAKLLAPQIQNIQKQGQQQNQTAAQFGTRSGGTNAGTQSNIDSQRANVDNMISQLTGQGASGLASVGENSLATGLSANQVNANESQQQLKNQQGSLLGGAITGAASAGLDAATGDLFGGTNPEAAASNWAPPDYLQQTGNNTGLLTDDELGDVSF